MHGRRPSQRKVYPTYNPYPVSRDSNEREYSHNADEPETPRPTDRDRDIISEFFDLAGDPTPPAWSDPRPVASNDVDGFKPLRILQSLFADRVNFLHRALEELETAKGDRTNLACHSLEDLDREIAQCERYLALLQGVLNDPPRRQQLERRLLELKRERRREALTSWRDLVWLRGEIRKLQRDLDAALASATPPNRDAPM
jgi:hypothetical protein